VHRAAGAFSPRSDLLVGPDLTHSQALQRGREIGFLDESNDPRLADISVVHCWCTALLSIGGYSDMTGSAACAVRGAPGYSTDRRNTSSIDHHRDGIAHTDVIGRVTSMVANTRIGSSRFPRRPSSLVGDEIR
jgi:hypothetical protein